MDKTPLKPESFFNVTTNPNLDAADTGIDPVTGKYLSKKERIAIFRNRKIKAGKVFGAPPEQSEDTSPETGKKGSPILNLIPPHKLICCYRGEYGRELISSLIPENIYTIYKDPSTFARLYNAEKFLLSLEMTNK